MVPLLERLKEAMKDAMRAKQKERLGTIRMLLAAVKQYEVDERKTIDEPTLLAILDKSVKQRRESIKQYNDAGRTELADIEQTEIEVIQEFLPQPLTEDEINQAIEQAINETGAESMKDMGKIMGLLKPQMQGRADMSAISQRIKAKLS